MWGLVLKVCDVTEGLRPNITLIVFWKMKCRVDHHYAISTDISIDTVLCNCTLMVAAKTSVFNALNLLEKFVQKPLGGVYAIVSTVLLNSDAHSYILSLKLEFGLDNFISSKAHLMNDGNLTSICVTE